MVHQTYQDALQADQTWREIVEEKRGGNGTPGYHKNHLRENCELTDDETQKFEDWAFG